MLRAERHGGGVRHGSVGRTCLGAAAHWRRVGGAAVLRHDGGGGVNGVLAARRCDRGTAVLRCDGGGMSLLTPLQPFKVQALPFLSPSASNTMAPKAKAHAKAKATAKACRPWWSKAGNDRQAARRAAVRALNMLATKFGLSTIPMKTTGRPCQRLIQRLQTRCSDGATRALLRDAARRWQANGGFLDAVIIDPEPLAEVNDLECEEGAPLVLPRHKVLKASFRLDSKAFMLT